MVIVTSLVCAGILVTVMPGEDDDGSTNDDGSGGDTGDDDSNGDQGPGGDGGGGNGGTENLPPNLALTVQEDRLPSGSQFVFTTEAVDPEGGEIAYAWDMGDGTTYTGGSATHVYNAPGTYLVNLTVTDPEGAEARATVSVDVTNTEPVIDLQSDKDDPLSFEMVNISSGAEDPDGDELVHDWEVEDLEGDVDLDGPDIQLLFKTPGPHPVTLTVRDTWGGTCTDQITIDVGNRAPRVEATASPENVKAVTDVVLGATATDMDGYITLFEWDLDGDGTFETDAGNDPEIVHRFDKPGTFNPELRVTDDLGATAQSSVQVTVDNNPPNVEVEFLGGPFLTFENVTFILEADDIDGTVEDIRWDLDGDGKADVAGKDETEITHAFSDDGVRTVTVQVEDDWGAVTAGSVEVQIANRDPTAIFTSPPMTYSGGVTTFNGKLSTDMDGAVESWNWDFGDGSTGSGSSADHVYSAAGTYTVKLTVMDDDGGEGTSQTDIQVMADLDRDGIPDDSDPDRDNDGLINDRETSSGSDPDDPMDPGIYTLYDDSYNVAKYIPGATHGNILRDHLVVRRGTIVTLKGHPNATIDVVKKGSSDLDTLHCEANTEDPVAVKWYNITIPADCTVGLYRPTLTGPGPGRESPGIDLFVIYSPWAQGIGDDIIEPHAYDPDGDLDVTSLVYGRSVYSGSASGDTRYYDLQSFCTDIYPLAVEAVSGTDTPLETSRLLSTIVNNLFDYSYDAMTYPDQVGLGDSPATPVETSTFFTSWDVTVQDLVSAGDPSGEQRVTRGRCHDYANMLASMLQSVGIPSRVISGYELHFSGRMVGDHSWTEAYLKDPSLGPGHLWYVMDAYGLEQTNEGGGFAWFVKQTSMDIQISSTSVNYIPWPFGQIGGFITGNLMEVVFDVYVRSGSVSVTVTPPSGSPVTVSGLENRKFTNIFARQMVSGTYHVSLSGGEADTYFFIRSSQDSISSSVLGEDLPYTGPMAPQSGYASESTMSQGKVFTYQWTGSSWQGISLSGVYGV